MKRRSFIELSFLAACGAGCASKPKPAAVELPKHRRKLRVAFIGVGGRGAVNIRAVQSLGDEIAALCDVDETVFADFSKTGATRYRDFRVMLEMERDLDAVFVSTPDHGHAIQAQWALERGLPVYMEPPLARTLSEARRLRRLSEEKQVPLWLGIQTRSAKEFRRAVSCVNSGLLGDVRAIHVWTNRPLWPQGASRPDGTDPVPRTLDWDLWLGPAPLRPYKRNLYHAHNWRGWCDFGTGTLGDAASQLLNLPFSTLNLSSPRSVQFVEGAMSPESFPKSSHLRWVFREAKKGWFGKEPPPITLDWYDGGRTPSADDVPAVARTFPEGLPANGCAMVGDRGVWLASGTEGHSHFIALNDELTMCPFERHEACEGIAMPRRNIAMQKIFLDAIRLGKQASLMDGPDDPLTETILLGTVAQQLPNGFGLTWNAAKGRFENAYAEQANELANQPARENW